MEFLFKTKTENKNNLKVYFVNQNKLFVKNTDKNIFGIYTKKKDQWEVLKEMKIPSWFDINAEIAGNAEFPEKYNGMCENYTPKIVRGIRDLYTWTYRESPNFLGLVGANKTIGWQSCRDSFAGVYNATGANRENILFCSSTRNEKIRTDAIAANRNVAKFIRKVEDTLGDAFDKDNTVFYESNFSNVVDVQVSEFWQSHFLRSSLFTALLRCGLGYVSEADNFEKALYCQSYTANTKPAVQKFMDGFVNITIPKSANTNFNGWAQTFANGNIKGLKK